MTGRIMDSGVAAAVAVHGRRGRVATERAMGNRLVCLPQEEIAGRPKGFVPLRQIIADSEFGFQKCTNSFGRLTN